MRDITFSDISILPLPPGDDRVIIGIEVPATHPVIGHCHLVLDPQHGGGVRGFRIPTDVANPHGNCAAAWALAIVESGWICPSSVLFVSPRWDADASAAAAILSGDVTPSDVAPGHSLIELDQMDQPAPNPGTWRPGPSSLFCPLGEHMMWGPVNRRGLASVKPGQPVSPENIATAVRWAGNVLASRGGEEEQAKEGHRLMDAWQAAADSVKRGALIEGIWVVEDHRVTGGSGIAYRESPVVIFRNPEFHSPSGWIGTKYTVMVHPGAPANIQAGLVDALATLAALEPDWGGQKGGLIFGSPMDRPSSLDLSQVVDAVSAAMVI